MGGRFSRRRNEPSPPPTTKGGEAPPPAAQGSEAKQTASGWPEVRSRVCEQKRQKYEGDDPDSDVLPPFKLAPDEGA